MNGKKSKINISKNTSRVALLGILSAKLWHYLLLRILFPYSWTSSRCKARACKYCYNVYSIYNGFYKCALCYNYKGIVCWLYPWSYSVFMSLAGGVLSTIVMCVLLQIKKIHLVFLEFQLLVLLHTTPDN